MELSTAVLQKIKNAPDFAPPIIMHLLHLAYKACPLLETKIKWGHISFEYKGIVGGIGVFKHHVTFGFWKHNLLKQQFPFLNNHEATAMGSLGKITHLKQLPPNKQLIAAIQAAVALNQNGIKLPTLKRKTNLSPLVIPTILAKALQKDKLAKAFFNSLSPSAQKEYIEYIDLAKTDTTKNKRLAITLDNLQQSKKLNWQYESKKNKP